VRPRIETVFGDNNPPMFEQAFKNIDDVLWKEAGCTTELDYTEQTSWLLFLKYLDGLEEDQSDKAKLEGKRYSYILERPYRWESWAAPKDKAGRLDHNKALTGDDLRDFVDDELFPYLQAFTEKASGPNTIEYKIGQIFGEIKNKIQSGYNMREIIDHIDALRFRSQAEKHELSHLYEAKIRNMGNAGRNGGEYYTPRPLIRAIVQVVNPKLGETIYDGAVGSAGFLCEAYDYLKKQNPKRTTAQDRQLQEKTFYGKEKKSLAYVIAIMNMILHGIEAPNILHTNTLTENLADIQEKDRFDIVLANPPFGGNERSEVQQNFSIRASETAYLFLQHFIRRLKTGGRAGVVIKNTFLSNDDNSAVALRKMLLETCDLTTVLDCPGGTFPGAAVGTVVLFFTKGAPTRNTWFYQLTPGRRLGKTQPLRDEDLADFLSHQRTRSVSPRSWVRSVATIDKTSYDLSVRNPARSKVVAHRKPRAILGEVSAIDRDCLRIQKTLARRL
jgi:type I restriction enzyme M protein